MEYIFSDRLKELTGNSIREIFKLVSSSDIISFAGGLPATECLPIKLVERFSAELLGSGRAAALLQYGATEGNPELRQLLTQYVKRAGIAGIRMENVLIISGGQQGIDLSMKAFVNEGDAILVENPTYLASLHIAKTYRANPIGVNSLEDGIDLEDLEDKIKRYKPKLLYIVPNFQNPTGKTLSLEKRKKVAEITARYGVMVIEDDPYRELRYGGQPLPAIKSFDEAGNVIYVTSFSKVISPGLRVGAAIAHEKVIYKLTIGKQAEDVHTNSLAQAIVEKFISDDTLDKWIQSCVPVYRAKRDIMAEALKEYMPKSFKFSVPEGGLFIWGQFDKESGIDAAGSFRRAIENKVAYVSGNDFFADGSGSECIRLNFSNATHEKLTEGVKRLAQVFSQK